MTKKSLIRYSILCLATILAIVLVLSLYFGVPKAPAVEQSVDIINFKGDSITAVKISDLLSLNTLTAANYTPDTFLIPVTYPQGKIVPLNSSHRPAKCGTYQFVILNLEPTNTDFNEQSEALSPFFQGDNKWHVSLYLPNVWSACTIYVGGVLVESIGKIENYNYADYSDYQGVTERHKNGTKPIILDITFPTKRESIPAANPLMAARVITIHYQTADNRLAGMTRYPLIGVESTLQITVSRDNNMVIAVVSIATLVLTVFILLCFLKHTLSFLPQLLIALGVLGIFSSTFALSGLTNSPFIWLSVGMCSCAFMLFSSLLSLQLKFKSFRFHTVFVSIVALLHCIATAILPFMPVSTFSTYRIYSLTVGITLSLIILAMIVFYARKDECAVALLINPLLVSITTLCALFIPSVQFAIVNPVYWMCFVILAVTLVISFRVFVRTERRNRYLTSNLQNEVERQTADLQAIITERDHLLRYTSHDLKKPVVSMQSFLRTLRDRESDEEQRRLIHVVSQKANELHQNLTEIGSFARLNFIGLSHVCIFTDDIGIAVEYYQRILGAIPDQLIPHWKNEGFFQAAGFIDEAKNAEVSIAFLSVPGTDFTIELMQYHSPVGRLEPVIFNANDVSGARHVALKVTNIEDAFEYIKAQPDVTLINTTPEYKVYQISKTCIEDIFYYDKCKESDLSFKQNAADILSSIKYFYFIDKYGLQWEFEQGHSDIGN